MIIVILVLLVGLYGVFIEPHLMKVRKINCENEKKLGLKIAQFSDTHFTWHTSARRFRKFAKNMEKNQPDVILFTGDLFDKVSWAQKHDISAIIEILSMLSAPLGKFAIFGNHDFENGNSDFVREVLEKAGFTVLKNQTMLTDKLALSGIDDLREGQPDFALSSLSAPFSLMMIHEPDSLVQLENLAQYDLVIAGHSHGGQIRLGKFRLRNDGSKFYDSGKYQITSKTTLYVNNGIGLTFLPIRIGVPPEITYYQI